MKTSGLEPENRKLWSTKWEIDQGHPVDYVVVDQTVRHDFIPWIQDSTEQDNVSGYDQEISKNPNEP